MQTRTALWFVLSAPLRPMTGPARAAPTRRTRMIAFRDSLFDAQLLRTLGHAVYGGAAICESLAPPRAIADGDRESWYQSFTALADRTFAAAEASAKGGHRASAEGAYLRASSYYRTA